MNQNEISKSGVLYVNHEFIYFCGCTAQLKVDTCIHISCEYSKLSKYSQVGCEHMSMPCELGTQDIHHTQNYSIKPHANND